VKIGFYTFILMGNLINHYPFSTQLKKDVTFKRGTVVREQRFQVRQVRNNVLFTLGIN
jgi:hypothetical protein